ncbi:MULTISPECIES: SDR family NAD(P)-dependent oxidoreductase [unclassified Microbacterium]|uniref:SDR family NAD(P)-dependent oxidoreductase n=1 Tax=unclassified Microbacterium TaxID=2609290 RepID=UPI0012F77C6A|nr:SDR family NAD(P)-dependent oxidoreductase [Microbacterium sp. MAH-37]MVQ41362.1 SDR family oxidoreductase [Microbacterium sp. MAH-37]
MPAPDITSLSIAEMLDFRDKVVVITGAAKGIGLACARRFAEAGGTLVLLDIDESGLVTAVQELRDSFDVTVSAQVLDMADADAVKSTIATIVDAYGRIDVWVNNAGIFPIIDTLDLTDDEYDQLHALNQRGMFLAARTVAQQMTRSERPGVIINMVSVSGLIAATNAAHYVAAKHAIVGATKAFARDLAPHGIRVLAIAPTLIETPGVQTGLAQSAEGKAALDAYLTRIPLGRAGAPDEVARVVLFAASGLSGFMTGTTLVVDGGELVL